METVDYEKVLADLEAKRATFNAAVDSAIQGIRHVLSAVAGLQANGPVASHVGGTAAVQTPSTLTPDLFFGLSIGEAAVKYLAIVKKQQKTREIADGLEGANYHHQSANFVNTVNTALYRRERDEGDVVRIGRNWALADWYPGRRRKGPAEKPDALTEATASGNE